MLPKALPVIPENYPCFGNIYSGKIASKNNARESIDDLLWTESKVTFSFFH